MAACPDFEFQITSATPISDAVRNVFNDNAAAMGRCAENPNCTVVFTNGNTGVNVQTGPPGGGGG